MKSEMVQIINGDNSLGNSQTAKIVYNRALLNRNFTFAFSNYNNYEYNNNIDFK